MLSPAENRAAWAPEGPISRRNLTVGNPTMVSGSFFHGYVGANNTSDIDVRTMLHGYNTVEWSSQLQFVTDPIVVSNLTTGRSGRNALYTVTLQQGTLPICDGTTPITAKDYVFSLLLCTSPQAAALGAESSRYSQIVGYDEYHSGEAKALRGVRLIDDYTFSIAVKAEYEPFFYDLAKPVVHSLSAERARPLLRCGGYEKKGCNCENIGPRKPGSAPLRSSCSSRPSLTKRRGICTSRSSPPGPYQLTAYDKVSGKVDFAITRITKATTRVSNL